MPNQQVPDHNRNMARMLPESLFRFVQWYDDAIPRDVAASLISGFNELTRFHSPNGRGYKPDLEDSSWTELNITQLSNASFQNFFHAQIDHYLAIYNESLGLTIPVPGRFRLEELRMKRYRADIGERFQPHFDSVNDRINRYLVFLWYLNDVTEGGETFFCDLDHKVAARTGRLLIFPPYWMFQHAGLTPISNDKYILSTYLLF